MLTLLICCHGPYATPARTEESERNIKQMDHQTIPEQRAVSLRTLTHITPLSDFFLFLFTRGVVAQRYLLRPIIKRRRRKQTCKVQRWKGKQEGNVVHIHTNVCIQWIRKRCLLEHVL